MPLDPQQEAPPALAVDATCAERLATVAALPGSVHGLAAPLARLLVDHADGPRALAACVARRDAVADRLVCALVTPAEPEARLLGRAWSCTGWERIAAEDRATLHDNGRHDWIPAAGLGEEATAWIEDLRQRVALLVAARVAGESLKSEDLGELARVVALDADLWALRSSRTLARARTRRRDVGDRVDSWSLEAADRQGLAQRLERGVAVPVAGHVTSRLRQTLGVDRLAELCAALADQPALARLERVLHALDREDLAVPDPARGLGLLLDLARTPGKVILVAADPDPLLMAVFVLERGRRGALTFPLPPGRALEARQAGGVLPDGVTLMETALEVDCGAATHAGVGEEQDEKEKRKLTGNAALKDMVLRSMQSTSAILAFLRDPKVAAIPGLVEEVTNRTRNPQILETIATTRTLHCGFANRGVPMAVLRSPVNVSIRIIRRFIHVKYVSKIELNRMAVDKSGIRRDVTREVIKYLDALT